MALVLCTGASGCELAKEAPPLSQARLARAQPEAAEPRRPALTMVYPSPAVLGHSADPAPTAIDVVLGGDVVPQARMLTESPKALLSQVLPLLAADAFVFNLEGPLGSRKAVPKDKTTLAFATPADWLSGLLDASHATAFGAANNHACDLEQDGLIATRTYAEEQKTLALGIDHGSPWKAQVIAEREGRRVCTLSWTTFLNDDRRRHDACRSGRGDVQVARASLDKDGFRTIRKVMNDESTWATCDVRIANVHGGVEYRAQSAKMMYLAHMIAPHVDAIVFGHTHVPDGVELIEPGAGSRRAKVPVFRSLGNLLSNQGAAWSEGMATTLLGDGGAGDPIRTVWTRVAMLARLRFGFSSDKNAPVTLAYGYDLAFLDRTGPHPTLMPLVNEAPIAQQLRRGTFGAILDDRCRRVDTTAGSALPCQAE